MNEEYQQQEEQDAQNQQNEGVNLIVNNGQNANHPTDEDQQEIHQDQEEMEDQ